MRNTKWWMVVVSVLFSSFGFGQGAKKSADLLVTGGMMVTMDGPRSIYD
jgi:hypothetical protein